MTPRLVLHDDAGVRAGAVAALVQEAGLAGLRVARVGNPLRSPLTLDRILMQVAAPDEHNADPRALAGAIARPRGAEGGVLLLVEDADTLHPSALRGLAAMATTPPAEGQRELQLALVGRTSLRAALDADELAPLRAVLGGAGEVPPAPAAAPPPDPRPEPARPQPRPVAPLVAPARLPVASRAGRPRRGVWVLRIALATLLLCGVGVAAVQAVRGVFYRPAPPRPALAVAVSPPEAPPAAVASPAPAPSPPAPSPSAPTPAVAAVLPPLLPALPPATATPEPAPAPEPAPLPVIITPPAALAPAAPVPPPPTPLDQTARLRRDFEAFLARSGRGAEGLTEEQRSALFEEYLQWRAQAPGNAARSAPRPDVPRPDVSRPDLPRILLHVPAGAGAASARVQALLRSRATVETRPVSDGPPRPTILFFHRQDEAAARQAADWMAGAGLPWVVQDMTGAGRRAAPGSLEAWLPD